MAGSDFLDNVRGVTAEFEKQAALRAQIADLEGEGSGGALAAAQAVKSELDAQVGIAAKIATFDAERVRALSDQAAVYKKMREDALGITAANEKAVALAKQEADAKRQAAEATKKERAQQEAANEVAASWKARNEGLATSKAANDASSWADMGAAAGGVAAAGLIILHAAEKLASAAIDITKAGVALSVEQTSKKEIQGGALGKLGGDYDQTVHMALKMGMDPGQAITETKKLLNAKFASTEIPALLRVKAGMDLTGLDGDALLKKLETIKLGSKVGTKDVEGLKKLGIDVGDVYKEIASKTGQSMDKVKASVKAGTADASQVVAAIEKVAGDKFGGVADKLGGSVPALLARIKGDFMEMFAFDPATLEPIKAALKTVAGVLEGPDGAALKASLSEIFVAFSDLFKGVDKQEVTTFVRMLAKDAHELAGAIVMAAPAIKDAAMGFALITAGGIELAVDAMIGAAYWAKQLDDAIKDPIGTLEALGLAAIDAFAQIGLALIDGPAAFVKAGYDMAAGLAEGIMGGASAAIDAAVSMANSALAAAKNALGIHSPSAEFGEAGDMSAEGYAQKLAAHPGPAAAASGMADKALRAANDNAKPFGAGAGGGDDAGAGGGGSPISLTFSPQITLPPGSGAENAAAVKAALASAYPEFLALARRAIREAREGGQGVAA